MVKIQMKIRQPQILDPRSSQLGSTADHQERHIVTTTFLVELPLDLGCITCTGIVGTCNCFGSICESRGVSNLTPVRSRLFKLIGKDGIMRWSCSRH